MPRPRLAVIGLLLCAALLAGCAQAAASLPASTATLAPTATPLPSPTSLPSPTPVPTFAAGSRIAGVDVAGLDLEQATALLGVALAEPDPLNLRIGATRLRLDPATIALAAPLDELLAEAASALASGRPAAIPARLEFAEPALRAQLTELAAAIAAPPEFNVITSTNSISRSFAYRPGMSLDLDQAVASVRAALAEGASGTITLELSAAPTPERVPLERLREEIAAMAAELPGVVGLHLIDLESGESIGFHDRSVFAGASTIKTAIMLYAYLNLPELNERQEFWLNEMIRYSDNLSANDLLAAGAGGLGTELAFVGADEMSTLLQAELGLRHTYLYVPYETTDFIKVYKPKFRCGPSGTVGERPYTEMGACLRAEPASMARLYHLIDQCANDEGELIERYENLNAARCQEMLDWLALNEDDSRLVAGVPAGTRVEHKSGWIEDMQSDSGIVRSPGGDYILAIYYYRPIPAGRYFWTDDEMTPILAAFSRLAYTAYNPLILETEE